MKIAIAHPFPKVRKALEEVIRETPSRQLLWSVGSGADALQRITESKADLVIIDAIFPDITGDVLTQKLIEAASCDVLIVTDAVHQHPDIVFQAMGYGAVDVLNTPFLTGETATPSGCNDGSNHESAIAPFRRKLAVLERLRNHRPPSREPVSVGDAGQLPLIAIGASTGGPAALARLLGALPADLPATVVVVQHVDPSFARGLAEWLDQQCALRVRTADAGYRPQAGEVLVANSGDHLVLGPSCCLEYTPEPADYVFRPSVDVFFSSAARHWPNQVIGVLLTGMGRDGAEGLLALRRRGSPTLTQNRETCAVYGMPKAAVDLNAAGQVLAIDEIAPAVMKALQVAKPLKQRIV